MNERQKRSKEIENKGKNEKGKKKKRGKKATEEGKQVFYAQPAIRPYHGKAVGLLNRYPKKRKNSLSETRSEPTTASPHWIGNVR